MKYRRRNIMVITTNISLWCINYIQARVHKSTQCTQYMDVVQVYQNQDFFFYFLTMEYKINLINHNPFIFQIDRIHSLNYQMFTQSGCKGIRLNFFILCKNSFLYNYTSLIYQCVTKCKIKQNNKFLSTIYIL